MIQAEINAVIVESTTMAARVRNVPFMVEFSFDEENDPLALMMIFKVDGEEEVCWTMGRELVMRGTTSLAPVGEGDVRVRADHSGNAVLVCLASPEGHADITLNREEMIDFLNRTQAVCKLGEEPLGDLIDRELEDLLGGEDS